MWSRVESAKPPLFGRRILLVDEQFDGRRRLALALVAAGADVDLECDSRGALDVVDRKGLDAYDVLVADLADPGTEWQELVRMLQARGTRMPIVLVTAEDYVACPEPYRSASLRWTASRCPERVIETVLRILEAS